MLPNNDGIPVVMIAFIQMGLDGSPDIFQAIINDIMGDLPNVRAYLDNILVTMAGSYEDRLTYVKLVLQRLMDV